MATGQSKIYLDIEARLRGNEDIKALNKTIKETEDAATGADNALVRAAKTLGVIPATKAQNRIDSLTKAFEQLKQSGVLSAEQIDAAYERTLATINKISSAGAGEKFAASQGRETPAQIKARGDLEIAEARRVAAETKAIETAAAADRTARQAELLGIQQRNAQMEIERRARIESAANDRVLAIRERFDRVIASKSPEFQQGVRNEAMGSAANIKALKDYDEVLAKTGITARQTNAALRMLPAQFSDIVVSLQGGQAPLTVFLQQGAQIKDSFGGVGNAVRELGKFILGMVNPVNVAITALTAYGAILYTVEKQQQALARAVVFSGNAIGMSTSQLNATAQQVAKTTNSTIGSVTELVGALAESGKISAESLSAITEAAVRVEKVGGMSLKEMTALMISLGKDPQKGLLELADKYGIVSLAIQGQVKTLIELGRQEEAIALAQKFAADEFTKRAKSVEESTGTLIRVFKDVKKFAVDMWNSIFDLGRTDVDYQIKTTEARIASLVKLRDESEKSLLGNSTGGTRRLQAQIDVEQKSLDILKEKVAQSNAEAQAKGEVTRAAKEASVAQEEVNKVLDDAADKQTKLNKAIAEYRINVEKVQAQRKREGLAPLTAAQIAQGERNLRNKFTPAPPPTVNTFKPEAAEEKKELIELQLLANERKRLYDQNLIDLDTYYKSQRELLDEQSKVAEVNATLQRMRLEQEEKKFAGDPEKLKQVRNEIAKLDLENFKFQGDQVAKVNALEDERLKTVRALRIELDGINKTYLDMVGQGTSAEALDLRRLEIAQKYSVIEDKINTALSQRNVINGDELQRRKDQIAAIRAEELAIANLAATQRQAAVELTGNSVQQIEIQSQLQRGLISQVEATVRLNELKREQLEAQIKILEAEVATGTASAERLSQLTIKIAELRGQLEQTIPTVQTFGDQFKVLFQDRIGNALGDVLTRTRSFKDAFKSLLLGIAQDIIRSNINKALAGLFTAGFGATGNLPGVVAGGPAFADGGMVRGPGTGTSDSIAARLSNGEFVIKAASVNKFGKGFFDMLNSGQMPAFANGGLVTRKPKVTPGFANGGQVTVASSDVTVNVINNSSQPVRARQEQDPRTGITQVILEDFQRGGPISRNINAITGTGRAVAR
jgi:hypothetical protein